MRHRNIWFQKRFKKQLCIFIRKIFYRDHFDISHNIQPLSDFEYLVHTRKRMRKHTSLQLIATEHSQFSSQCIPRKIKISRYIEKDKPPFPIPPQWRLYHFTVFVFVLLLFFFGYAENFCYRACSFLCNVPYDVSFFIRKRLQKSALF